MWPGHPLDPKIFEDIDDLICDMQASSIPEVNIAAKLLAFYVNIIKAHVNIHVALERECKCNHGEDDE